MLKRVIQVLVMICLLFSSLPFVYANEENPKTVWLEVLLDSSHPDGFNYDIEITLSNDNIKRTYTMYHLNKYKENYEMLQGIYNLEAKIINDQYGLYKLVNVPKQIKLTENRSLTLTVEYNFSEMMEVDRIPKEVDNESYVAPDKIVEEEEKNNGISSIIKSALTSICIIGIAGILYLYIKYKY